MTDGGVVGSYTNLERAKERLNGIQSGNRLIAEVNAHGNINRDPHVVGGQNQLPSAGFNMQWCDWSCINPLMDICEEYLKKNLIFGGNFFRYNRYNFNIMVNIMEH